MSKQLNKMPRQRKANNKNICNSNSNINQHATLLLTRHRCCFTHFAAEVFLVLLLLFTLPHAVHGDDDGDGDGVASAAVVEDIKQNGVNSLEVESQQLPHMEPNFQPNRTGIVELFEWKFVDVGAECTNFLGPKGFAGVQLSPVTEHLVDGVQALSWRARYQPISYKFATRSGNVEDFQAMSRACNAAGVRVYVDIVLNHMGGNATNDALLVGTAGSAASPMNLNYTAVPYTLEDFHKPCELRNYFDAHEVRNCQLDGHPDLDQSRDTVRAAIVTFLNELIGMGAAGFHVDAAKYMWPNDLKEIYDAVDDLNDKDFDFPPNSRPFFYQEVVDLGMDAVSKTEYFSYGAAVSEYLYAAEISLIFRGQVSLSSLINWGPAMGFLPHQYALVFVDTHETQHGALERQLGSNQLLSYNEQRRRYILATVFMLAHPYGRIKRIMSSYHFSMDDKERGPPMTAAAAAVKVEDGGEEGQEEEEETISSPEFDANGQCTQSSGWVCEHRWPAIANMLNLVNALNDMEDGVINFQTYGPNHIAFCRGQKAFIAINNDAALDYATTVHSCLESGVYCDVISGGRTSDGTDCHGKRIEVMEDGLVELMLPAMGEEVLNEEEIVTDNIAVDVDYSVIAIYVGSKLVDADADAGGSGSDGDGGEQVEQTIGPIIFEDATQLNGSTTNGIE